ncbi:hypothetical protein [Curtobacterium sp. MCLR17_034]|uniref:hypothetical protein n=1 Tax=Curtobacterium sp. MCLR17_034 TaxID=2175623 RepID=UPI0015E88FA1|nr:hypothetical protein [Curtobacterium sp. MCLR17_034]
MMLIDGERSASSAQKARRRNPFRAVLQELEGAEDGDPGAASRVVEYEEITPAAR